MSKPARDSNDVERLAGPLIAELRAARESLSDAISNVDILLNLLDVICNGGDRFEAGLSGQQLAR